MTSTAHTILVLGGTGKVGRRIAARLAAAGHAVRIGSRSTATPFDWHDPSTWPALVEGARAIFISYAPDLSVPGAAEAIDALIALARRQGVERLVLLSGRGEAEAQRCEELVRRSGLRWSICRAAWFMQNVSEDFLRELIDQGCLALPAGSMREPFVDCDDIAEVATAALTDDHHHGRLYELTGPELLSFGDVADELSRAIGRRIDYQPLEVERFQSDLATAAVPPHIRELLRYLFGVLFDGRNEFLADGVQRALGREPTPFGVFARRAAAAGAWAEQEAVS